MEIDLVNDTRTPITDETFEKQGWERNNIKGEDGEDDYYYWSLPLPKDNPDKNAPSMISICNDQWEEVGLKKGEYTAEIMNFSGLGWCDSEEDIEIVYNAITREELYDKKSPVTDKKS